MSRAPLRPRAAYRHWTPIQTRWSDNDGYGHVNNAVYYQWFDMAVNSWLIDQGLLDIVAGDPIGLVVETSCTYAASLAFPEPVEIGLTVARLGTSSVTYHLGAFAAASETPAAQGHYVHVYVGRDSRRPVPLPDAWRERLLSIAGD